MRRAVVFLVMLALLVFNNTAFSMGSLPTGPSDRENESEIGAEAALSGLIPGQVRFLTDREFQAVLQEEIEAAKTEIVVSAHLITLSEGKKDRPHELAEKIVEAAKRGVQAFIFLEIGKESSLVTKANRAAARYLIRRGVRVFSDMSGTVSHAKLIVIDRRLVFIGSHDITHQSLGRYREASLMVESPSLAISVLGFIESLNPAAYSEP